MAEINPYAPVVIDETPVGNGLVDERIFFGGTLTEADCQTVLLDHVPTGSVFTAWLRVGILVLLFASVQWLVGISAALFPILWMVVAMIIGPTWMHLVGKYWHRVFAKELSRYRTAEPASSAGTEPKAPQS